MYLSAHFDLAEFVISETAERLGIDNTPSDDIIDNLRFLASTMEDIRLLLGRPITITSGYRSPKLNAAVRGSASSQHMQGLACDFICPAVGTPYEIAEEIAASNNINFDQLIWEGTWVHVSVSDQPRHEVLTAKFNPTRYMKGLVK